MHDPTNHCPKCQAEVRLEELNCGACGQVIRTQPLLGEILIDERIVSKEQLETALKQQQRKLGEILVEMGACKAEDLDRAVHIQKIGRTRADMYADDLKRARAIGAAMALALVLLGAFVFHILSKSMFRARVDREQLTLAEAKEIMADPDSPYKFEALKSVSRGLNGAAEVSLIRQAMKADKWYIRFYAAMLAMQSQSPEFVPSLIPLLGDPTKDVALVAHQALRRITNQSIEPVAAYWQDWAEKSGAAVPAPAGGTRK